MADYPLSVYSPRAKENKSGVVYQPLKKTVLFVEDITKLDDEVVAIETQLGGAVSGGFTNLVQRLANIEQRLTNLEP